MLVLLASFIFQIQNTVTEMYLAAKKSQNITTFLRFCEQYDDQHDDQHTVVWVFLTCATGSIYTLLRTLFSYELD